MIGINRLVILGSKLGVLASQSTAWSAPALDRKNCTLTHSDGTYEKVIGVIHTPDPDNKLDMWSVAYVVTQQGVDLKGVDLYVQKGALLGVITCQMSESPEALPQCMKAREVLLNNMVAILSAAVSRTAQSSAPAEPSSVGFDAQKWCDYITDRMFHQIAGMTPEARNALNVAAIECANFSPGQAADLLGKLGASRAEADAIMARVSG